MGNQYGRGRIHKGTSRENVTEHTRQAGTSSSETGAVSKGRLVRGCLARRRRAVQTSGEGKGVGVWGVAACPTRAIATICHRRCRSFFRSIQPVDSGRLPCRAASHSHRQPARPPPRPPLIWRYLNKMVHNVREGSSPRRRLRQRNAALRYPGAAQVPR